MDIAHFVENYKQITKCDFDNEYESGMKFQNVIINKQH